MRQRVFDSHVHVFPDKIAASTVNHIAGVGGVEPSFDGTRSGLLGSMDQAGIDAALNCPIATRADQVEGINSWAIANNSWPVLSLGTMHPDFEDPVAECKRLKDEGIQGIKMHPEYQAFTLEESRTRRIWDAVQRVQMLLLLHTGADIGFPAPHRTSPETVARFQKAYPGITLVAAHLGGWHMWDRVEQHLIGSAVNLDLSFVFPCLSIEKVERLVREHGWERILFASDAPWASQQEALTRFEKLQLPGEAKACILWGNAMRLLGFEA